MEGEVSKKLFIFIGLLFLFLMLGPYFGVHPFGAPELPKRPGSTSAPNVRLDLVDEENLGALPEVTLDGDIIENEGDTTEGEDLLFEYDAQ